MDKKTLTVPDKIKFNEITRENLKGLFNGRFSIVIPIEVLGIGITNKDSHDKNEIGRYATEKRQFLSFLMDPLSSSAVSLFQSTKYDYMKGFLLFLSANDCFRYGFGYFKEREDFFIKFLNSWNSFLNRLISDIKTLPEINYQKSLIIEVNGFLLLTIKKDHILSVELNYKHFDRIFHVKDYEYEFRLMIGSKPDEKNVIEAGKGSGKGKESSLHKSIARFNGLIDSIHEKNIQYIFKSHEQE